MPDKDPERLKPATDLLMQSSQQVASDRAKRINSLHNQVNGLLQEETKKGRQVGAEVGSIADQQRQLKKQLGIERDQMTSDIASGYGKVVNNLGSTIKQMSIGMRNISVSTAKASADAISQYGKAIGQDININKTNTIAMALSRATPIFGYFAAKFMETDVFRGAISKIRQGVGGAMVAGLKGAGSAISNIFRGKSTGQKIAGREREIGALSGEVASLKKELQAKPPKLQSGGYVKKGGVVEVHAAEIVAPVDSIVKQIVESTQEQQQKATKNIFKQFIKEFRVAKNPLEEAWQDRMLKAILELKTAFIGTTSRLRIAWQRTLLENPAFRGMLMFAEGFKLVLGAPIKWLFGARGGYLSDVKKATATDNVFLKVANLLGLLYTTGMPKLDAIAKYTRVSATVDAGYEPSVPIQDRYTMFQKVKGFLAGGKKKDKLGDDLKEGSYNAVLGLLGLDEEEITDFKASGGFGAFSDIGAGILELVKLKKTQEEREKPQSPSWVQYLGMTFGKAKERVQQGFKEQTISENISKNISETGKKAKDYYKNTKKSTVETFTEIKKSRQAQELQNSFLGRMTKRLRKLGGWGWKLMMFAFNMFQGIINKGVGLLGNILSPLLTALGVRGLFKTGGKGFIKTAGEGLKKGGKGAKKFAGKTARVQRMAGGKAAAKFAGKTALKSGGSLVGRVALGAGKVAAGLGGAVVGGVVGAGMGLYDAIKAGMDPKEYAGNWLARGVSGFLGGTESGASGALSGAMKLGGIGAAIGLVGGPIGVAIGGAIGAAAGAILGFVGGKNLSKGIAYITGKIKSIAKGVYNVVMFPWRLLKESIKFVWKFFTETETGQKIMDKVKNAAKFAWDTVTMPYRYMWSLVKRLGGLISEKWEAFKGTGIGKGVILAWDSFTKPFTAAWKMIANMGTTIADMWNGTIDWIKGVIKKIQGIPFIGKFVKGIKEITAGTFADKKIEQIKTVEHYSKRAANAPGGVERPFEQGERDWKFGAAGKEGRKWRKQNRINALKLLGAQAGVWDGEGRLARAHIDGKWYKVKVTTEGAPVEIRQVDFMGKTLNIPVQKKLAERKATAEQLINMGNTIADKMDETSDTANKISSQNTTVLTNTMNSSTSNVSNSGGGGSGGASGSWWGSGDAASRDVTYSTLN